MKICQLDMSSPRPVPFGKPTGSGLQDVQRTFKSAVPFTGRDILIRKCSPTSGKPELLGSSEADGFPNSAVGRMRCYVRYNLDLDPV